MPSSRKRNKAKERKAKKAESKIKLIRETWRGWVRGTTECNHNIIMPEDNHPVYSFIDSFCINNHNEMEVDQNLLATLKLHPQVWSNDSDLAMAICILIAIGTNFLLVNMEENSILYIAHAIIVLENYGRIGNFTASCNNRAAATKFRDLYSGGSTGDLRDLLKFFRKRLSCSCLKEMHLYARKTQPKLGRCSHCHVAKERSLLMVCSRCMIDQYCSRRCQVADWPRHKECECDRYVCVHRTLEEAKELGH